MSQPTRKPLSVSDGAGAARPAVAERTWAFSPQPPACMSRLMFVRKSRLRPMPRGQVAVEKSRARAASGDSSAEASGPTASRKSRLVAR